MLFSNPFETVLNGKLFNIPLIENGYRILCQNLNVNNHYVLSNINRRPGRSAPTDYRINKKMTFKNITIQWNLFNLIFIVLLSIHGQSHVVYGARSRDNLNSIYLKTNNHSVNINNDKIADDATPFDLNDLEIIDIDDLSTDFQNVTDPIHVDEFSRNNRKLKRLPIYQNEFAVYVPHGPDEADTVAERHGFTNAGQVRL